MSQDSSLVRSLTPNSDFSLEISENQYNFEGRHQMTLDNEGVQWTSDSSVGELTFSEFWALGNKGNGLENEFGHANKFNKHQHIAIRPDGSTLEELIPRRNPNTPPPLYQPFQQYVKFVGAQQNVSNAYAQDGHGDISPNPQAPSQAAKLASVRSNSYGLASQNLAEAKSAMLSRHLDKVWFAPIDDNTVSINDEERAAYITKLLEAMKDTSACSDKRKTPASMSHWTPDALKAPHPEQMEKVCWQLVDIAERLHVDGPVSLSIYDKQALRTAWKSRFLTFAERMSHLSALLRLFKSRCFSLLKGENLETTVSSPAQRFSGTMVNCVQNGKRQEFIKEGRPVWRDKNGEADEKTQPAPVDAQGNLSSKLSTGLVISARWPGTGDAHEATLFPVHAPLPASDSMVLTDAAEHIRMGSVDGGTVRLDSVQMKNTSGNSWRGNINIRHCENNRNVDGNPYYVNYTPGLRYPGIPHLRPCDVPRPTQLLKRTAGDAQLDAGPDLPPRRPRFGDQVHRSDHW